MARDSTEVKVSIAETSTPGRAQNIKREHNLYEFSAPQFYDFNGPSPGMPQSESWFGN